MTNLFDQDFAQPRVDQRPGEGSSLDETVQCGQLVAGVELQLGHTVIITGLECQL